MLDIRDKSLDSNKRDFRFTRWLLLATLVLIPLLILFAGCGKRGTLSPLEPPVVTITSYEGVEDTTAIADPYFFQRRIYWRGESRGGTVEGYAYRVLDVDGEPVVLPRRYIDEEGWIYHYKPGADQSIPITDPTVRTIWTTRVFDVINFPAAVNGDSTNVVSRFEIKCRDNYDQESEITGRYFNVTSHVPDLDIIFGDRFHPLAAAEGAPGEEGGDGRFATVGLGFEAEFTFMERTPFTTNTPNYFMFQLEQRNIATGETLSQSPADGEWFTTRQQRNIRRVWLAQVDDDVDDFQDADNVYFVLRPDEFANNNPLDPLTETLLRVKAVNMASVQSAPREARFFVYDDFEPQALIYQKRTNVLGENHFTTFQDASIQRPLPEMETPEGIHFATPFFYDSEGNFTALWSQDIRIYLSWGWRGQFVGRDPDQGFINEVHDVMTGLDYLASVKYFDLRLDGQPYYYPPLWDHPEFETRYKFVDPDGTEWLRVPRFYPIDTRAILTGISPGENEFEVRIVDSQNKTSAPESLIFTTTQRIPDEEKAGILIIDNETYQPTGPFALDPAIDDFYDYIVANIAGPVETINRRFIKDNIWDSDLHRGRNVISPTDLESYKLVIWHSDNPVDVGDNSSNFHQDFDTINLYMRGGGNILLSAGSNLRVMHQEAFGQAFNNFLFQRYFGIPNFNQADNAILSLSSAWTTNPYMIGADQYPGSPLNVPDLDLNLEFNSIVEVSGGLGPVAYFNMDLIIDPNVEPLYTMKTVEAGADFAGVPVALRRATDRNTTYLFGFPLSYMDRDQVRSMLNLIINDLGL